jgi:hypothetical protein
MKETERLFFDEAAPSTRRFVNEAKAAFVGPAFIEEVAVGPASTRDVAPLFAGEDEYEGEDAGEIGRVVGDGTKRALAGRIVGSMGPAVLSGFISVGRPPVRRRGATSPGRAARRR